MGNDFTFQTVPEIVYGAGALKGLSSIIKNKFSVSRIMIITDKGLIDNGLVDPVLGALHSPLFDVEVFSDIVADPPTSTIDAALCAAREFQADLIIGLGGGSSMDAAKLVAVLLKSEQTLDQIYGVGAVRGARLTGLVLIPTTAGTGSEVTPISIVTTGETQKMGVVAPQLYADIAVLDASLTVGLPASITAATGIDAMVHAIEAYTSRYKKNPMSDMLARQALKILSDNIETAVADGQNIEARSNMLLGAMWAGQAFANAPVAAVHALAYPLGGIFHVPHGLSNSLVLPYVLDFNLEGATKDYAELARFILPNREGADDQMAQALIERVIEIRNKAGIERHLREVGVREDDIERLADDAMLQTRLLVNNPREVTREDVVKIYKAAF